VTVLVIIKIKSVYSDDTDKINMKNIFLCSQFIFKSIISLVIISESIIFSKNIIYNKSITFSKNIIRKEQKTLIFQRFYVFPNYL